MILKNLDFSGLTIIVVGDVILDEYLHGSTTRISPEAPVPVIKLIKRDDKLGGAANVALNISKFEVDLLLIGVLGCDDQGKKIKEKLNKYGINHDFVEQKDLPTTTKTRIISQKQQLFRIDKEGFANKEAAEDVYCKYLKWANKASAVIISDYNKGCLQACDKIIAHAKRNNKLVVVDPKGDDYTKYTGASIITPNLSEFEAIVGRCDGLEDVFKKGIGLIKQLNIELLLVTLGERGMYAVTRHGEAKHLKAISRDVFDVTGAGDTVISVFTIFSSYGYNYFFSAKLANIAAGLVVEKLGTETVTLEELLNKLYQEENIETGIVSLDKLLNLLSIEKLRNTKIVFTNGCFDILHAGHVQYLKAARQLGDKLVVAVNTDSSVKKTKGNNRPINELNRRMSVLAELKSVDWVIHFDEETPDICIKKIKPDVLVKGGDYKISQIVGADFVRSYGGIVKVISFLEGHSTTNIIKKCLSTT